MFIQFIQLSSHHSDERASKVAYLVIQLSLAATATSPPLTGEHTD